VTHYHGNFELLHNSKIKTIEKYSRHQLQYFARVTIFLHCAVLYNSGLICLSLFPFFVMSETSFPLHLKLSNSFVPRMGLSLFSLPLILKTHCFRARTLVPYLQYRFSLQRGVSDYPITRTCTLQIYTQIRGLLW